MAKFIVFILILVNIYSANQVFAQKKDAHYLNIKNTKDLFEFFKYTPDRIPMVCAHRGGTANEYPENSIALLEYTLSQIDVFFEIDPRLTKDSVIVVMHDATLDRTTTGTGNLNDYTWAELQKLKLKDAKGNATIYGINTLDEVLQWSKGKTILMLDKKDVPTEMLYQAIRKNKAQSNILISSYLPEEAKFYHQKDKTLMFEAFIRNMDELKAYEKLGIPWKNIVAYLGQPKKKELYEALHERGIMCMIFSAKVLEKNKDKEVRKKSYTQVIEFGGDILLSDRAIEASKAIELLKPKNSGKFKFFTKRAD